MSESNPMYLPWTLSRNCIDGCDGECVCNSELVGANKFIVRAVNSHADLIQALEAMIDGKVGEHPDAVHPSRRFCTLCGLNNAKSVHGTNCPVAKAEAALAKSSGKES